MTNDLSLNTLIISGVVAVVGYLLKSVGAALLEAIKSLIVHLVENVAEVKGLKRDLVELIQAVGDIQKIRYDLNNSFARIKQIDVIIEKIKDKVKIDEGH